MADQSLVSSPEVVLIFDSLSCHSSLPRAASKDGVMYVKSERYPSQISAFEHEHIICPRRIICDVDDVHSNVLAHYPVPSCQLPHGTCP